MVSTANTDFNYDQGASYPAEKVRGLSADSLPPIVAVNAAATGTDINGYLSESPAVSVFTLQGGAVYQTYAITGRGVELLMNYILDRVPAAARATPFRPGSAAATSTPQTL
jgi:predicted dithiol-disulfide oxidoreductase (DUF899 family)